MRPFVVASDTKKMSRVVRCPCGACLQGKKEPDPSVSWSRANTWRRPTLTGPIVPLPSALWRFTSGFGMGPGGSTTLWSPENNARRWVLILGSDDRSVSCAVWRLQTGGVPACLPGPLSDIHMEYMIW